MTLITSKEDSVSYECIFYDQQLNNYIINHTNGSTEKKQAEESQGNGTLKI